MYTYTNIHTYIHTHTHTHTHTRTYTTHRSRTKTHTHSWSTYTYTSIHTYIHPHIYIHNSQVTHEDAYLLMVHIYIHMDTHTHIHPHIYIHNSQIRAQKRMSRYLVKLHWLTYTHRYDLLRTSRSLLTPSSPSPAHNTGNATAGYGTSSLPSMVITTDDLNDLLAEFSEKFPLPGDVDFDEAQQFAFVVKNLMNSIHAWQVSDLYIYIYIYVYIYIG
jgi:hypothetical protein